MMGCIAKQMMKIQRWSFCFVSLLETHALRSRKRVPCKSATDQMRINHQIRRMWFWFTDLCGHLCLSCSRTPNDGRLQGSSTVWVIILRWHLLHRVFAATILPQHIRKDLFVFLSNFQTPNIHRKWFNFSRLCPRDLQHRPKDARRCAPSFLCLTCLRHPAKQRVLSSPCSNNATQRAPKEGKK